jgi:2-polyprenyl-3-methyl-5-hydroxy-6-metoxy-1,4-benzoquinol methylase
MERKCDLCNGRNFRFLFKNHDRMLGIPGEFNLVKCDKCGLVFINPSPSKMEVSKYYPKEKYYSLSENPLENMKLKIYRIFYKKGFSIKKLIFSPLKFIVRSTRIRENGNFLDIGCGDGKFLRLMREFGMSCYGIEPNNPKKIAEDRLKILNCELKDAKFKSNFFDVITLNHVFEHVNSPSLILEEIYRILKPGGHVIIATPNIGSLTAKLFGKYWLQLDTPRHLFLYSEKTMRDYAEKEGFKVDKIRYNSTPMQFSGSLSYLLGGKFQLNKIVLALFLPATYILNMLHTGDQFEFILSKK